MRKLIITPKKLHRENDNINGPTVIKVPKWINDPLGRYYMYFAHHRGSYIKLAYSNNLLGTWNIYQKGVLDINQINGIDHIASPEIYFKNNKIVMIYHSVYDKESQLSSSAISDDGINFIPDQEKFALFYFRRFVYKGKVFGVAKNNSKYGCIYKLINGKYQILNPRFIFNMRHCSILVRKNLVYCYYTKIGDCPERVMKCKINMSTLKPYCISEVFRPLCGWEGSEEPIKKSKFDMVEKKVHQIRDPYVYRESKINYIFYTVQGENGISVFIEK